MHQTKKNKQMKNIKTLLIAGLLISSSALFAQEKKSTANRTEARPATQVKITTPEERAKNETEKMRTTLNLTETQVERVSILNLKVEEKIQAIMDSDMTKEKKKEFIAGNMNDKLGVLSTILSKEQLNEYKTSIAGVKL